MYKRAFATIADDQSVRQLKATLGSIFAYHSAKIRVFVFGHGLSERTLADCFGSSPLGSAITVVDIAEIMPFASSCEEVKCQVLFYLSHHVKCVCLMDAGTLLLCEGDSLFSNAEKGVASLLQGDGDSKAGNDQGDQFQRGSVCQVGELLSGAICINFEQHKNLLRNWNRRKGDSSDGTEIGICDESGTTGDFQSTVPSLVCQSIADTEWFLSESEARHYEIRSRDGLKLHVYDYAKNVRQRFLRWAIAADTCESARSFDGVDNVSATCIQHFSEIKAPDITARQLAVPKIASGLRYVGELSLQDVQVLATHASTASRVLEFGVGASTQIFAQVCVPSSKITCIDTSWAWIKRTKQYLSSMAPEHQITFYSYEQWIEMVTETVDMVFVDGVAPLRRHFAMKAWNFLRVGGTMLFHDTRRTEDVNNVLELIRKYYLEVDNVEWNVRASNITCVRKKVAEPYLNWNTTER